ncbi:hypothetical protein AC578_6145 [Pseudocercospora eumusae]|uniref:Uncharacterized protein n=1 Tax=Pseudocercospora eumusae TaxID=321146 RepID=A0A139H9A1_9PEZI|nr:hypothetical protein AC578_6145 [Pseudocercospora eumusae]
MPPTTPLPLIGCQEDHLTPEAESEMEAEIKIMKVQILVMAPRIWRQHKVEMIEDINVSRPRKSKNRPEIPIHQQPLRPRTDFIIRDQEYKNGTLLRDTQGRVRSIEWMEYSANLALSPDNVVVQGPAKYSRKDAIEALFKLCRQRFNEIRKQEPEASEKQWK